MNTLWSERWRETLKREERLEGSLYSYTPLLIAHVAGLTKTGRINLEDKWKMTCQRYGVLLCSECAKIHGGKRWKKWQSQKGGPSSEDLKTKSDKGSWNYQCLNLRQIKFVQQCLIQCLLQRQEHLLLHAQGLQLQINDLKFFVCIVFH
mmetsp:Transcript_44355/g.115271  ORF Transcript_44355/g.115271 Transcript_44355/m.115271 type:complete len:149 (+) Transcript_44355:39-485(+)